MADLDERNSSSATKIVGAGTTGVEAEYINSTSQALWSIPRLGYVQNAISLYTKLAFSGNESLVYDGSVTPRIYSAGPPVGQIWDIWGMTLFIQHKGTPDPEDFGSITPQLPNGLLFETVISATAYSMRNCRTNMCLSGMFSRGPLVPASGNGWWNDNDTYQGEFVFARPTRLTGSASDVIRVTVRDNLSLINNFRIGIKGVRLL